MPASLRRALRLLRLALVCLALVWSSAPAAAAPITDTIAWVAVARAAAPPARAPAMPAAPARAPVPHIAACAPLGQKITATHAPPPPRRLYLEHCALLC